MARVLRFLKVLKNHPKKTIFFSALGSYGIHYANNRYEEEQLLRAYCTEASWYGDQHHLPTAVHRHITVLLNPAAAGGKCLAQFEKYCAPLLHLAGLKVAVVRTEHQGQARDLMAIMEKTDGVVLAGGDGTLSEVSCLLKH
ncbi:Diacylglycerol kinase catalytic domain [Trinorchestia longiramus]|nr:Diacylglycerol kinase catalytic domain [Trinorchestia longiramus]